MMSVTNALSHDATSLAFVPEILGARLQLFVLPPFGAATQRILGRHDVGHECVATGCGDFSIRSFVANPQGVAPSRQSTRF